MNAPPEWTVYVFIAGMVITPIYFIIDSGAERRAAYMLAQQTHRENVCLYGSSVGNNFQNDSKGNVVSRGGNGGFLFVSSSKHKYCLYPDGTMKDYEAIEKRYKASLNRTPS